MKQLFCFKIGKIKNTLDLKKARNPDSLNMFKNNAFAGICNFKFFFVPGSCSFLKGVTMGGGEQRQDWAKIVLDEKQVCVYLKKWSLFVCLYDRFALDFNC